MAFCTNCGASVSGSFCTQCGKPMSAAPPAAAPAGAAPAKKKTSPLVWVLVGIAGLFVILGLLVVGGGLFVFHKVKQAGLDPDLMQKNPALAMTKFISTMNPDIEVLAVDEGKGTIRVKDKKNGKTFTMNFEDAKRGKFTFQEEGKGAVTLEASGEGSSGSVVVKSPEGSVKIGTGAKLPAWVPSYPSSAPQGDVMMQSDSGESGSFHFTTKDAVKKVFDFYEQALKQAGFKVTTVTSSEEGGMIAGEDSGQKRKAMVTLGSSDGETTVNVTFEAKK